MDQSLPLHPSNPVSANQIGPDIIMNVTLDNNTTSLLFCALLWGFILGGAWLMNRTGKHEGSKRHAEGFKAGVEHADKLHEIRMSTAQMIADSQTRRVESEIRHEQFMWELDEKYPEVSRVARERDQLQRELADQTQELEAYRLAAAEGEEWLRLQTSEEFADRHVVLQMNRDEAIDAGEYSEPGEIKVIVHDETSGTEDHATVTVTDDAPHIGEDGH